MPTIQSKQFPGNEQFVPADTWKKMKELGRAKDFKIIDDGDMQDTVIAVPMSFTDFSKPTEPGMWDKKEEEMNREDLKKWLTEHEIEFSPRISTPKLYQLYLDNK